MVACSVYSYIVTFRVTVRICRGQGRAPTDTTSDRAALAVIALGPQSAADRRRCRWAAPVCHEELPRLFACRASSRRYASLWHVRRQSAVACRSGITCACIRTLPVVARPPVRHCSGVGHLGRQCRAGRRAGARSAFALASRLQLPRCVPWWLTASECRYHAGPGRWLPPGIRRAQRQHRRRQRITVRWSRARLRRRHRRPRPRQPARDVSSSLWAQGESVPKRPRPARLAARRGLRSTHDAAREQA